ncbi:Skp family chaperone for outer membrane proteins [Haloferula luteola]|uniref:Skp family chaperone for outer membrane proteins n=1 Tax=Haloferula luteola TaxID=595692 RepID=A0A840V8R8_9BACT|nr:OmpH family outer membrane protein [Haloferula luteola]MBB5350350.1 Skp family chaperone for outer membrane proteins [Haloferula luteola]
MLRLALGVLALTISCISAAPEIAGVRIADIYRQLKSSQEIAIQAEAAKTAVAEDPRFDALREVQLQMEDLKSQISTLEEGDTAAAERLRQQLIVKSDEEVSLRKEVIVFQGEQFKAIHRRMVDQMEAELAKLHAKAAEIATTHGYPLLIDLSGKTNTTLPFVIYAKDPVDLTDLVLADCELIDSTETPEP